MSAEYNYLQKLVASTAKAIEVPSTAATPIPDMETAAREAAEAEAKRLALLRNPPRGR